MKNLGSAVVTFGPPNCPHCGKPTCLNFLQLGQPSVCLFCFRFGVCVRASAKKGDYRFEILDARTEAKLIELPEIRLMLKEIEDSPQIQAAISSLKKKMGEVQ